MPFSAEVVGENELRFAWGQVVGIIKRGTMGAVSKAVKEGAREARTKHTFKNRTRALERSIEGFVVGWTDSGNMYVGYIRAGAKHASFVEYPTRAHEIKIRKANWLHWVDDAGDHHFAKKVRHPGTKGQPFMHLAYYKAERVLIREAEITLKRAQEYLER